MGKENRGNNSTENNHIHHSCQEDAAPKRDSGLLSSNGISKKMDSEIDQVNAELSSSKKRKGKKKKLGHDDVPDKSDKIEDLPREVETVQPKRDPCQLSSNISKKMDSESDHVNAGCSSSKKRKGKKKKGHDVLDKSGKDLGLPQEVETVQPKSDMCLQSSNDISKKMDLESNQVNAEMSSSKKSKQKKRKSKHDVLDKRDKDQDLPQEVETGLPTTDLYSLSSDDINKKEDSQSQLVNTELSSSKKKKRKKQKRGHGVLDKSDRNHPEEERDPCLLSSYDIGKDMSSESNQVKTELSSSKKRKKKKQKSRHDVLDKSDKDQDLPEEVETVQPKSDPCLPSSNDFAKNTGSESDQVNGESNQVNAEASSATKKRRKKQKSRHDVLDKSDKDQDPPREVEIVQQKGDPCPPSSNDFAKKMGSESDQVNVESNQVDAEMSSSKKRKRKKQKSRHDVLDKSDKDQDLPQEVETVQPKSDPCPPSSNDFAKMMGSESDQVNMESNRVNAEVSSSKMRKRKKQKSRHDVLDKTDKDQDLPQEVETLQPKSDPCPPSSNDFAKKMDSESDRGWADVHQEIPISGSNMKKLLILDINGLLADIRPSAWLTRKPDTRISGKAVYKRPFCDDFLRFCFERFNVAVWSSRTKTNVDSAVNFLMGDFKRNLLFCWDQSHCTSTRFTTLENTKKPLVLKELKKVWEKTKPDLPWETGYYNESNTLLVDDSPYKALRNPAYTAIFPQPYQYTDVEDRSLGPGGDLRVYLEGLSKADTVQKYVERNPFGQEAIIESNQHWHFYSQIL